MLPVLTINPATISHFGSDLLSGRRGFVGRSYLYHLDQLRDAAIDAGENVDRFITKHLAAGMAAKPVKSKLLFWFAPGNNLVWLSACDRALKVGCFWMRDLPGYWESGQEFVRDNARPYAYWNGSNLYRIYELPEYFDEHAFYASDLGNAFGIGLSECDEDMYSYIRDERQEKWDYSVVPQEGEEITDVDGRKLVVLHAYWTDGNTRLAPEQDAYQEEAAAIEEYMKSVNTLPTSKRSLARDELEVEIEPIRNKWRHGPTRFTLPSLGGLDYSEGMLPFTVILDEDVGNEVVLIIRDNTEFMDQLKRVTPFTLKLKTGVARNDYGSLGFLLFWIENPGDGSEPFAAYDIYINPTQFDQLKLWRTLGSQSHWHLFLVGEGGQQEGCFEFENRYGLLEAVDNIEEACRGIEMVDFMEAKRVFVEEHSIMDLFRVS